jgi:hypothetical protein
VSVDVGRKSAFVCHFSDFICCAKKIFAYFSSMNSYVRASNQGDGNPLHSISITLLPCSLANECSSNNTVTMDHHSRGSKRRWTSNDGDATATSTTTSRRRRDVATSSSSQQRIFGKNDLSEKTTANIDGGDYGYLSADDDVPNNTAGGGGKKKKERTARKEQRMGVRSFPRATTAADDENMKRSGRISERDNTNSSKILSSP